MRTELRNASNPSLFSEVGENDWNNKYKPITKMNKKKISKSFEIIPKRPIRSVKNPATRIKPRLFSSEFLTSISMFSRLKSFFPLRLSAARSFCSTVGFDDRPGFFDWGSVISELSIKIDSGLDLDTMLSLCLRQKPDTRNSNLLQPSFAHFL